MVVNGIQPKKIKEKLFSSSGLPPTLGTTAWEDKGKRSNCETVMLDKKETMSKVLLGSLPS